jgi:hypothetical protein
LSEQAQRAIAAWRTHPSDFEQEAFITRPEVADQANAFIWAFNLAGFVKLTRRIFIEEGPLAAILVEENFFRMAITARHTPVSIAWQALGYERAWLLPGRMGNMLLRPSEVAAACLRGHLAAGIARGGKTILQRQRRGRYLARNARFPARWPCRGTGTEMRVSRPDLSPNLNGRPRKSRSSPAMIVSLPKLQKPPGRTIAHRLDRSRAP